MNTFQLCIEFARNKNFHSLTYPTVKPVTNELALKAYLPQRGNVTAQEHIKFMS
jgi:hypothetical protein